MILELDCGNSLIKWRVLFAGERVAGGSVADVELLVVVLQEAELQPTVLRLVSVRADAETRLLIERLQQAGIERVLRAEPALSLAGVANGYADHTQLGLDRWLTAVAGYVDCGKACLVLDLGTAVTVDYVAADGRHLGGFIAPGLQLMRSQLKLHTRRIRYQESEMVPTAHAPGDNTRDAVERGCMQMLQGFVFYLMSEGRRYLGDDFVVYLTGGDAELVAPLLPEAVFDADLVFAGLALACPIKED